VAVLDEALARGYWYPQHFPRDDEDLRPLQGLPAFKRIMERSRERQAAMEAEAKTDPLVREPPPRGEPGNLAAPGVPREQSERPRRRGDPRWPSFRSSLYPGSGQPSPDARDSRQRVWTNREQAVLEIQTHWVTLSRRFAIDPERSVAGGFSVGGHLALWLILAAAIPVRRFFVVGPSLPPGMLAEVTALAGQSAGRALRGYIVVSGKDLWSYEGSLTDPRGLVTRRWSGVRGRDAPQLGARLPAPFLLQPGPRAQLYPRR